MTLKDMMLGTAIAALVAGGAVAQEATSTDPSMPQASSETEMNVEAETGTEGSSAGVTAESETELSTEEPSMAAETPDAGSTMAPETETSDVPASIEEMTVAEVVGQTVTGVDDETIGEIDYVVQLPEGLAFVIGIGGFLGLGEYTVAIPADQFSIDENGYLHLASMTRSDLEALPEFDESSAESLDGELKIGELS